MAVGAFENLRGFATGRPPLVVFMFCLGGFAVVLVSLAYYVKVKELSNPDVTEDWNMFLKNFGDMEFCVTGNESEHSYLTSLMTQLNDVSRQRLMNPKKGGGSIHGNGTTPPSNEGGNVSVSVEMVVELQPTFEFSSIPHNVTHLSATLNGDQLGFVGGLADAQLNMTLELPYEWNRRNCPHRMCPPVKILTCVTLQAPSEIFPATRRPVCNSTMETGIEYRALMVGWKGPDDALRLSCNRKPMVRLQHKLDRTLSVMLSMHDRSVINLHLMHTSYFLFVMVITLFCYALIKGRPVRTIQYVASDKVPVHA